MPRKDNENNPLQIRVRVKSIPKSVSRRTFYQRLLQVISEGKTLPPKWDVELWWRNPKTKYGLTKKWRSDDFESAVNESRDGFNSILYGSISRQLRRSSK